MLGGFLFGQNSAIEIVFNIKKKFGANYFF